MRLINVESPDSSKNQKTYWISKKSENQENEKRLIACPEKYNSMSSTNQYEHRSFIILIQKYFFTYIFPTRI